MTKAQTTAQQQLIDILRTLRYAQTRLANRQITADRAQRSRIQGGLSRLALTQSAINRMAGDVRALETFATSGFAAARLAADR